MTTHSESIDYKTILDNLTSSVSKDLVLSGADFFEAIAKRISEIFSADYVFVGLLANDAPPRVQTICLSAHGQIVPNITYELEATPCANVVGQSACCYPSNICSLYPDDILLQDMKIEGYIGVPLYKSDGSALGIIVALFENSIPDTTLVETIIQLYATRTANEIERLEIKQELEESNAHFYEIFNSAPVSLIEIDLSKLKTILSREIVSVNTLPAFLQGVTVVDLNSTAQALFNINSEFQSSDLQSDKMPMNLKNLIIQILNDINFGRYSGEISSVEYNLKQLTIHWVIPEKHQGDLSRMIISVEDVTSLHQLEQQLFQSQKMEAVGQLAGGVAHDFNNMLTGIIGAADLIKECLTNESDTVQELLDIIIKTGLRSSDLTSKLLTFARSSEINSTVVNISTIIDETVAILKHTIDKRVNIKLDQDTEVSTFVGDNSAIQNVLMNLAINSSHAMNEVGTISITTTNTTLDTSYCNLSTFNIVPGHYIKISVQDSGCGIPHDDFVRIFEPFFTTKPTGDGTGLGLSAAFGTVINHAGEITVQSEVGVGTTFTILLPVAETEEKKVFKEEVINKRNGTILLVDDEEIIRVTSNIMLKNMGYNVLLAENGEEGFEIYKSKGSEIDMVITDMIMPKMNGTDLFYELRKIDPSCSVIISSGFTKDESIKELKHDGLTGFITKPFRQADLAKVLP